MRSNVERLLVRDAADRYRCSTQEREDHGKPRYEQKDYTRHPPRGYLTRLDLRRRVAGHHRQVTGQHWQDARGDKRNDASSKSDKELNYVGSGINVFKHVSVSTW